MYNILINTDDNMFCYGVNILLRQVFNLPVNETVLTIGELTPDNIARADVIVMEFTTGESAICHHTLQARKAYSIVLGFYDGTKSPYISDLPLCLNNTVFIKKTAPVDVIIRLMQHAWTTRCNHAFKPFRQNCFDCKHKTLTPQQIQWVNCFYRGEDTNEIAKNLNVKAKTASTHKRTIMKQYNLNTDYELIKLLKCIRKVSYLPGYFVNL